jgi:hypothetical protein
MIACTAAIRNLLRALSAVCLLLVSCAEKTASAHPDEKAILAFVERYFATWSAQDMEGYGALFDDKARVYFLEKNGSLSAEGKTDFLHSQKMAHAESKIPMTEVPIESKIMGDMRACQVEVKWKLTQGERVVTGLDYFTLKRDADGWKIVSLLFYQD